MSAVTNCLGANINGRGGGSYSVRNKFWNQSDRTMIFQTEWSFLLFVLMEIRLTDFQTSQSEAILGTHFTVVIQNFTQFKSLTRFKLKLKRVLQVPHECQAFSRLLYNECSPGQLPYCVLPVWEGATLSQINSLVNIQVCMTFCAVYRVTIAFSAATHTHTHSLKVDKSTVVRHVWWSTCVLLCVPIT